MGALEKSIARGMIWQVRGAECSAIGGRRGWPRDADSGRASGNASLRVDSIPSPEEPGHIAGDGNETPPLSS